MSAVLKAIFSVFTTICMLHSMIGIGLFGTDNINDNYYGDVAPGGRFMFAF